MRIKIFEYVQKSLTLRVFLPIFLCLILIFAVGIPYVFSIIEEMKNKHASQVVLDQNLLVKSKIINTIHTEFARSIRFAESELTIRWSKSPDDPYLTELFFEDAKNFYNNNKSKQMFIALLQSNNYYFNSIETQYSESPRYELSRTKPKDLWFYKLLDNEKLEYDINVDHDWVLDRTNVWFNVLISDNNERYGLTGTGIPLESFVSNLIKTDIPGLSIMILDEKLRILVHPSQTLNMKNAKAESLEEKTNLLDLIQLEKNIPETINGIIDNPDDIFQVSGNADNGRFKLAFSYIPEMNWIICTQVELSQLELIKSFGVEVFFIIILLSLLLLYLLLTILVNKLIILPINRIKKEVRSAIDMDYSGQIIVKGHDELSDLSILFNDLIRQVRKHTQNLNNLIKVRTAELLKTQDQVFQQQYAESLGKLVIALSHQFNTPLGIAFTSITSIEENTNNLDYKINEGNISKSFIENYSKTNLELSKLTINNLNKVIQVINVLSHLKLNIDDSVSEFSLVQFFSDILKSHSLYINSYNVDVKVDIDSNYTISTYKRSLSEVINILIENSLKYAFKNHSKPQIEISATIGQDNRVLICFSDNGSGIKSNLLQDIFDPFILTRVSNFGFGVGLFKGNLIVKSILKGNLNIKSSKNIGTTVTIDLPNFSIIK